MTCELTIFTDTEITRQRNGLLESVQGYLAKRATDNLSKGYTFGAVQFLKVYDSLVQVVKIPFDQSAPLDLYTNAYRVDYAVVRFQSDNKDIRYYYYVDATEWVSRSCLRLYMTLDTLQTFFYPENATGYDPSNGTGKCVKFTDRTLVRREHKNRWYKAEYRTPGTQELTKTVARAKIDRFDEGLTVPLFRSSKTEIIDYHAEHAKCNLIYKNENDPDPANLVNPVHLYLGMDTPSSMGSSTGAGILSNVNDIPGNGFFLSGSFTLTMNAVTYTINNRNYFLTRSGSLFELYATESVTYDGNTWIKKTGAKLQEASSVVINTSSFTGVTPSQTISGDWAVRSSAADNVEIDFAPGNVEAIGIETSEFDRTDAKLIKVIKTPYAPVPITETANATYDIDSPDWLINNTEHLFELTDLSRKFQNTIRIKGSNPLSFLEKTWADYAASGTATRDDKWESKLLNSSFREFKFVYDTFSMEIPPEVIEKTWAIDSYLSMKFVTSSTINSRFLFSFPIRCDYEMGDYTFTLSVARNNEAVLYNSAYVNYVRTGYNYDQKAKDRTMASTAVKMGASVVGGIAAGLVSSNPIIGAITAGIGIVTSLVDGINTQIAASDSIPQKLKMSEYQAVGVSGSDDIDLLESYGNNHAFFCVYEPIPDVRKSIADLFYYCGYACCERKVPNLHTHKYFKFLQCDAYLETYAGEYVPKWAMDDMIARLKEGVTIYTPDQTGTGDLNPTKNNIELYPETITIYQ